MRYASGIDRKATSALREHILCEIAHRRLLARAAQGAVPWRYVAALKDLWMQCYPYYTSRPSFAQDGIIAFIAGPVARNDLIAVSVCGL